MNYLSPEFRLFAPELDFPTVPVGLRYCIVSSPRTGSTMLCSALRASRIAGVPFEYLNHELTELWARTRGAAAMDLAEYLAMLEARRTTPNGVFGSKLHYHQFTRSFGNAITVRSIEYLRNHDRIIFVTRADKLSQAVSFTIAKKTGEWNRDVSHGRNAHQLEWSDDLVRQISQSLTQVVTEDWGWRRLLAQMHFSYIEITYESLISDFDTEFTRVLRHLGLNPAMAQAIKPTTAPVGNGNAVLRRRYLAAIGVQN